MSETQPQSGMRRIPFPTESYEHPSRPLSAKRLLNCFAEQAPADARSQVALRTVPGLVYRETLGTGPVYVLNTDYVGGFYAVSGTVAYRNQGGVTSALGTVGMANDLAWPSQLVRPSIAISPDYAVICVPPRLYVVPHASSTMTQIDTTEFPGGGCNSIAYCDGYFVGTQAGIGNKWFISNLGDPYTWDALDFASADSIVNILRRVITHRGELWLVGVVGIEVWNNTGAPDFPFRRLSGGVIQFGLSPRTVAQLDNSVWGLGYDGCVYRSENYKLQRVSTHAIEAIIEAASPDAAFGCGYMQEGHAHYCLTLADLDRTLAYDAATKQWHDRSSGAAGAGAWRPLVVGRMGDTVVVGDAVGRLYRLDPDGTTDNGAAIFQQVTTPPLYAQTRRAFCARAEVEMEAPPATNVGLSWSDDGGETFTTPRILSGAMPLGERRRLVTTRLGSFRQRAFRITTTGRVTLYAMDADINAGAS
jgi:hypothetical protein